MKIIDLLNKIANGELEDIKFKYNDEYFKYWKKSKQIDRYENDKYETVEYYNDILCNYHELNDEVEIIEDNKIEKIELDDECIVDYYDGSKHYLNTNRKDRDIYIKKINEIIDYLNSKGDE